MAKRAKRKKAPPLQGVPDALRDIPKEAIAPNGLPYARARLEHPKRAGWYYRQAGTTPWVTTGYDTWSMDEWVAKFGGLYLRGQIGTGDGRKWDFFGEPIKIWDDTQ